MRVHEKKRSWTCKRPACIKTFTTKQGLTYHEKVVHCGTRGWKCAEKGCGKVFGQKCDLKRHQKGQHDYRLDWTCGDCDRNVQSNDALVIHRARCLRKDLRPRAQQAAKSQTQGLPEESVDVGAVDRYLQPSMLSAGTLSEYPFSERRSVVSSFTAEEDLCISEVFDAARGLSELLQGAWAPAVPVYTPPDIEEDECILEVFAAAKGLSELLRGDNECTVEGRESEGRGENFQPGSECTLEETESSSPEEKQCIHDIYEAASGLSELLRDEKDQYFQDPEPCKEETLTVEQRQCIIETFDAARGISELFRSA